jgi:ArsR family transcriptional regulator
LSRAEASRWFQALGDETRLALLLELTAGERIVGELVEALGCPQPKVSRHLKVLKAVGLVRDRRDGRHVVYALATRRAWSESARDWVDRLAAGLPAHTRRAAPAGTGPDGAGAAESAGIDPHEPAPAAAPRSPRRGGDLETHLL